MANEEIVLSEQLHRYLQKYAESTELTAPTFHVTKGSNVGDNFVGVIYRVRIESTENGKTSSVHLILKTASSNISSRLLQPRKLYQREIFFYREVAPTFKKILKKHGEIADLFPAMYDASDEYGNEILMLEDLSRSGFEMRTSKILDYPHLALALRRLGEFHAYSFIARAIDPTTFDKFKRMEEPIFSRRLDINERNIYPNELSNIVAKALMDEDEHYTVRFRKFSDNFIQNMIDATDGSLAEPYAVVNHGDAWTNNILFKYDQKSQGCSRDLNIPRDLRFLDLQLCRYASPVLDMVYILFCCCTQDTRRKHYDQLIEDYYEALSKCLERFGYDHNVIFPYEALLEQLITFGKFGAGMAICVLHIFTSKGVEPGSELSSFYDINKLEERLRSDNLYRSMLKGTFKDLIDKNYI